MSDKKPEEMTKLERQEWAMLNIQLSSDLASIRGITPPGWYPHQSMYATQQYWDGATWTDHIAPTQATMQPTYVMQQPEPDSEALIAWAWITAPLFPIVGFVLGIVLCAKGAVGNGVGSILFSVLATVFWAAALA